MYVNNGYDYYNDASFTSALFVSLLHVFSYLRDIVECDVLLHPTILCLVVRFDIVDMFVDVHQHVVQATASVKIFERTHHGRVIRVCGRGCGAQMKRCIEVRLGERYEGKRNQTKRTKENISNNSIIIVIANLTCTFVLL